MMKFLILFFVCFFSDTTGWKRFHFGRLYGGNLGAPSANFEENLIHVKWFSQTLNHYSHTDERKFQQRYFFSNTSHFKNDLVFLMIGGEGEAKGQWMVEGTWIDYAKTFGALCFLLEHRYYGKSQPMEDLSTENLQYLSSQQALGDIATFIEAMNKEHQLPKNVKWIVFGGFYSGSLAIWMRQKYPHLVTGAVSASAPMLAKLDFPEYYNIVSEVIEKHSEKCAKEIKKGVKEFEEKFSLTIGKFTIIDMFELCVVKFSPYNIKDRSMLYSFLGNNIAKIVQFNKDHRKNFQFNVNVTIDTLCEIMENPSISSPLSRLVKVNSLFLRNKYDCWELEYEKMLDDLSNVEFENEGVRQWTYQTCTEFGFVESHSVKSLFGKRSHINFFMKICADAFGSQFSKKFVETSIERTNTFYVPLDDEVTNVVIVHGATDPWHSLGTKTLSYNNTFLIAGTGHCAFLHPKSDNDVPELTAAREQVSNIISTWL